MCILCMEIAHVIFLFTLLFFENIEIYHVVDGSPANIYVFFVMLDGSPASIYLFFVMLDGNPAIIYMSILKIRNEYVVTILIVRLL